MRDLHKEAVAFVPKKLQRPGRMVKHNEEQKTPTERIEEAPPPEMEVEADDPVIEPIAEEVAAAPVKRPRRPVIAP